VVPVHSGAAPVAELSHRTVKGEAGLSDGALPLETQGMSPYVLLVEDEDPLAELLQYNLVAQKYRVERAADGEDALVRLGEETPDLVLLDWMLPGVSGIEICRQIRARPATRHVPILMLTARGEEEDRIRGLDTGADDYVVKPFSISELTARIRTLLRRAQPELVDERLAFGGLVLDRARHRVTRDGCDVHLGPTEYRLLEYLMQRPGRVASREQLLNGVWGPQTYIEDRTVDVHIGRLRKALGRNGGSDLIRTVRSAGYALDDQG